jgi:SulP family sulfate permease
LISVIARHGLTGCFSRRFFRRALLIASVLHLGKITSSSPPPVVTGFTSGIAVIIALGQIDNFFGISSAGDSAVQKALVI